ncbi:MAG: hypothetical protein ACM336_20760 [Acidobacteriota bacterium]
MAKKIGLIAVLIAAAFLGGFVPQYCSRTKLESELTGAQLRDLAALAYIQAAQKNYGLAAQTCAQFFAQLQRAGAEAPEYRPAFDEILQSRDKIIGGLAKGDPGVLGDLQAAYQKTRAATSEK